MSYFCPAINIVLKNTVHLKMSGVILGICGSFCNASSLLSRFYLNTDEITSLLKNLGKIEWGTTRQ